MSRTASIYISLLSLQAEDGIRDLTVTGVQTCALPISGDDPAGLRRGTRAAPADGRDRARPARSGLSLPDGEANGDQRARGGGGGCQGGPAKCLDRKSVV